MNHKLPKMKQRQLTGKITFLSYQMANLDETKSTLTTWDAARMNLAVLGSTRDVGVEIGDPQAVKMKQRPLTHKKPPISASRRPIWMKQRALSPGGTWRE